MKNKVAIIILSLLVIICGVIIFTGVDGKSAYELACENGYEGTLEEWLASLKADNSSNQYNVTSGDNYNITVNTDQTVEEAAAAKALLSTVSVYSKFTISHTGTDIFGRPYETTSEATGAGAGVIYQLDKDRGDAFIITNYHVVHNADSTSSDGIAEELVIFLYGMEYNEYAISAEYVGGSSVYDIAVLRVNNSDVLRSSSAVAATIADSSEVSILQTAIVIGNPEALGLSATVGAINVDSEYIEMELSTGEKGQMRVMRVDAAVNEGNSGGGLYDKNGNLIGIVNAKIISSSVDNMGYAIPSNIAIGVAQSIIDYCYGTSNRSMYKCLIGITLVTDSSSCVYDTETGKVMIRETVAIENVTSGGLFDGKVQSGDIIKSIEIDGKIYEATRVFTVIDAMLNARVGSVVTINVVRSGENTSFSVTIPSSALTAVA